MSVLLRLLLLLLLVSSPCSEFFFLVFCIILTSWTSVDRWQNLYFQIIEFIRKIETFLLKKISSFFFSIRIIWTLEKMRTKIIQKSMFIQAHLNILGVNLFKWPGKQLDCQAAISMSFRLTFCTRWHFFVVFSSKSGSSWFMQWQLSPRVVNRLFKFVIFMYRFSVACFFNGETLTVHQLVWFRIHQKFVMILPKRDVSLFMIYLPKRKPNTIWK